MVIHGLNKLTLLDFPEHTACTLFCGQCNFRCPFCQNSSIVIDPDSEPVIPWETIEAFLVKRKGLLTGVCITGGEPTLRPDLRDTIVRIKELGYKVKLDTNGYMPDVLEELIDEKLLDMVAMDIKSSRDSYARACGIINVDTERIGKSVTLLMNSSITYEFRTTMVRGLQTDEDMRSIGAWIRGAKRYYLQHYEDSDLVMDRSMKGFSKDEMEHAADIVRGDIPGVKLRGI